MKNLRSARMKNIRVLESSFNAMVVTLTSKKISYENDDISGTTFKEGEDLSNLNFINTNINSAVFYRTILNYSDFTKTNNTADGIPPNVTFKESSLINVKFRDSYLENSDFTKADITGADFTNALLRRAIFTGATLTGANFTNAKNLAFANFTGATLTGANFKGADNIDFNTNFTRANLSNNDFSYKRFRNVNFTGANLTNVNLKGANLTGANLTYAICNDCILDEIIDFTNILFSGTLKIQKSGGDASKSTVNNITQLAIQGGDAVDAIWINNTKYGGDGGSKSQTINVENNVFKEIVYHYNEFQKIPYIIVYLKFTTSDNQTIEIGTIRDSSIKQTLKNVKLDGIEVIHGQYLDRCNFILKK
jgi:uncharacterized protein YjbI with pentapeptide repeats